MSVVLISDDEPDFISLSDEDDDVTLLAIEKDTSDLIKENEHKITKKLSDIECPICFDEVTKATATSCGHVFCLECIQKSVSSSTARGQVKGKRGTGLCPLCRKKVVFKDTVVVRARKDFAKVQPPQLHSGKVVGNEPKNPEAREKNPEAREKSPQERELQQPNEETEINKRVPQEVRDEESFKRVKLNN